MTIKLYRGFNQTFTPGRLTNPWRTAPRIPTHTPNAIHENADEWFFQRFGVKARSSTIICSTSIKHANTYAKDGVLMELIPDMPYRLIFSTGVKDMLSVCMEISRLDEIGCWLGDKNYQMVTDMRDLPTSSAEVEVMVDCETYVIQACDVGVLAPIQY